MSRVGTVRYDIEAMRDLAASWGHAAVELSEIRLDIVRRWSGIQLTPRRVQDVKFASDALVERLAGPNWDSLASLTATAGAYLRRDADTILEMEHAKAGKADAVAAASLLARRFGTSTQAFLKWPAWSGQPLPDWAEALRNYVSHQSRNGGNAFTNQDLVSTVTNRSKYPDGATIGDGECRTFVGGVITSVAVAHHITLVDHGYASPHGAYWGAYEDMHGVRVDLRDAKPGDVIQLNNPNHRFSNEYYPGMHTAIIVGPGPRPGTFMVTDSNYNWDHKVVQAHLYDPVASAKRHNLEVNNLEVNIWRFGTVNWLLAGC